MRTLTILTVTFLAVSFLLQAQDPGLSIKLEVIKDASDNVTRQQVPIINVILTNTSLVKKVIADTGVPSDNIIVLTDSAGKVTIHDPHVRRVPPPGTFIVQSAKNVTLEPGQSISSIFELQRTFKLKSTESYKVFVKRKFADVTVDVVSNSVEVSIK